MDSIFQISKRELSGLSDTYHELGTILSTVILCSRICEQLVNKIYISSNLKPFDSLIYNIEHLRKSDKIPGSIAYGMQLIREYGNKARHGREASFFIEEDAFVALECLIRIVIWYNEQYCDKSQCMDIETPSIPLVYVWSDINLAFSRKLARHTGNVLGQSFTFKLLEDANDMWKLDVSSADIVVLIVTDGTKLSENDRTRKEINLKIESYVDNGGILIGFHDLIYRRCRNKKLEDIFGCQLNNFRRTEEPLRYIKTDNCDTFPSLRAIPSVLQLYDGEICWGTWSNDSLVLFQSEDFKPLVVFREYGGGGVIWINSGDYRTFPPKSLAQPQKELTELFAGLIRFSINREWVAKI